MSIIDDRTRNKYIHPSSLRPTHLSTVDEMKCVKLGTTNRNVVTVTSDRRVHKILNPNLVYGKSLNQASCSWCLENSYGRLARHKDQYLSGGLPNLFNIVPDASNEWSQAITTKLLQERDRSRIGPRYLSRTGASLILLSGTMGNNGPARTSLEALLR